MKKTHKLQGMALSLLTASMLLSFQLHAYDKYDIKKAYPGGEKVTHQGGDYQSQWYANPGEKPNASVAHIWENVWKKIGIQYRGYPTPGPTRIQTRIRTRIQTLRLDLLTIRNTSQANITKWARLSAIKAKIMNVRFNWCSGEPSAYAPGDGWAWESAWSLHGLAPEPGMELTQKALNEREDALTKHLATGAVKKPSAPEQ